MKTDLINKISRILDIESDQFIETETPKARSMDVLPDVMRYKQGRCKYELDGEHVVGLNLANTGLTNEKWQQILELPGFDVEHLYALSLSDNQLTGLPMAERMQSLKWLNLSDNRITAFSLPASLTSLIDLNLDDNSLTNPPQEIIKQGRAAVLRFLKESTVQGVREVFEVKMLIVGEGGTGKTTLWNLLQYPDHPVPDPAQKSTTGISIKEGWHFKHLDRPADEFIVNLWDFGGQDIQYMTHQFFLTRRSFYVLLADGRREVANFSYWFKIINLLGTEADMKRPMPVLVVLNEKGSAITRLPYDPQTIKQDFPKLDLIPRAVDFINKEDGRFGAVTSTIQHILCRQLDHLPLKIPVNWNKVRTELYRLRDRAHRNHINAAEFAAICTHNGVDKKQSRDDLSQLLHDLGVILHFHEDPALADFIVLNPQWATNAVYEIMKHEEVANHNPGRFDQAMLRKVWTDCHFSDEEQSKLLNLMLKDNFEVCFKASENGQKIFIAPQFLPSQRPAGINWQPEKTALRYIYQYPFMPKGIIGRLIVRLHEDIETASGRKIVWEKGMLLKKDGCRAYITEAENPSDGLKRIRIEIQGKKAEDRKYLLRDVRQELDRIHHRSFPALKVSQKIPCCCPVCACDPDPSEYDFDMLRDMENKHIPSAQCSRSHEMVSVQQLMNGVFPSDDPAKKTQAKKIYFSYAWGDEEERGESREKIVDELYQSLKKDGFNVLRDKMDSHYGDMISSFMQDIGMGDLIVVFVSDKYARSPYCMNELYEIARNSKFDKQLFTERILPVRVEQIKFDDPNVLDNYFDHWENEEQKWASFIKKRLQKVTEAQSRRYHMAQKINNKFGELSDWLTDINASTCKLLSQDDFQEVKDVIITRFKSNDV
jgi:internalin A